MSKSTKLVLAGNNIDLLKDFAHPTTRAFLEALCEGLESGLVSVYMSVPENAELSTWERIVYENLLYTKSMNSSTIRECILHGRNQCHITTDFILRQCRALEAKGLVTAMSVGSRTSRPRPYFKKTDTRATDSLKLAIWETSDV